MRLKHTLLIIILIVLLGCNRFDYFFYTPFEISITAEPISGYYPLQVMFIDNSILGSEPIKEWFWDFDGDGVKDLIMDSSNYQDTVFFNYTTSGTFTATFSIDDNYEVITDTIVIEVIEPNSPIADFNYVLSDSSGLEVTFHDTSIPGSLPISSWTWDFNDDGEIDSYEQHPIFVFPSIGEYQVTLTVSDGVLQNTVTKSLNVGFTTNIVIELFTGTWCTFCPFAEEALHELKEQYGSRLSYTEYHIGDPLDNNFGVHLNYYPNQGTLPLTIINGNAAILTNAGENFQEEVEAVLEPLLEAPLIANLTNAAATISGNQLSGSVSVEVDEGIDLADLKLVLVLQEDLNTDYTNYNGNYLHNTALKRNVTEITACSQEIDFSITELDELATGYDSLPGDLTLLIWVQVLEENYDQSSCAAYNVIEIPVEIIEN